MLDDFYKFLQSRHSSSTVFNQYQNEDVLNNLKIFLSYLNQHPSNFLLVGEAPGYNGCRITGIPFTSGWVILNSEHKLFREIRDKFCVSVIKKEPSATVFWEFFGNDSDVPVLWNAFPFHPHLPNNPDSNRRPTNEEVEEGLYFLNVLVDFFKPNQLCGLGRVGEALLKEAFPDKNIIYITHPARGNKQYFTKDLQKL